MNIQVRFPKNYVCGYLQRKAYYYYLKQNELNIASNKLNIKIKMFSIYLRSLSSIVC